MTSLTRAAERPAPADFAWRTLGAADARDAAEVIRAAFSAQSRATRPPSSALRETADSIAAKIAAGGGAGAFQGGSLVAVLFWRIDGDALCVGRVPAPTTALRAVPLPRKRGRKSPAAFLPCEAGEGDHAIGRRRRPSFDGLWRGGGGRRLLAECEATARERGARRMRLKVRLALPENERLFERFGFARRSVEAHEGFDAPTTAVMEKRLS